MPQSITAYRVFIASPSGLAAERQAFRDAVQAYNEMDALSRGVLFIPVGWEATLPGMGRPQSLINEELRDCDYFVLMLWDRWGSSPGDERYTSATSEEYDVARGCWRDTGCCLREIAAFFKAVEARQMSDPGEQLRHVLDFRRELERTKELLFGIFDDVPSLQRHIQRLLAQWVRDHECGKAGQGKKAQSAPTVPMPEFVQPGLAPAASVTAGIAKLDKSSAVIAEAQQLAAEGRLTDAETLFARAVVKTNDPATALQYARFLRRIGRFSQAQGLLEGILERDAPGEEHWKAGAYNYLGMLFRDRGEFEDAECMLNKAASFKDHPGARETMIASYNNLGQVFRDRGELQRAENMHRQALDLCISTGKEVGLAGAYGNLAHVYLIRGDLDQCEEMNRHALEITTQTGNEEGESIALRNQGLLLIERKKTDEAEQVLQRSLVLATKLGRQKSMADAYASLARIAIQRRVWADAEQLLAKAIEINERIGRRKGLARALGLLGDVQHSKGDDVQAERSLLRATEAARELGDKACLASGYLILGTIFASRGESTGASLLWGDARQLFAGMGMLEKVRELDGWLGKTGSARSASR